MSKFLQLVWICKVFLTGGSALRYCSETVYSPFCFISVFYSFVLFFSIFFTCKKRNGFTVLDSQETFQLQLLEEGFQETIFIPVKQNGTIYSSVRSWEDTHKEKYS